MLVAKPSRVGLAASSGVTAGVVCSSSTCVVGSPFVSGSPFVLSSTAVLWSRSATVFSSSGTFGNNPSLLSLVSTVLSTASVDRSSSTSAVGSELSGTPATATKTKSIAVARLNCAVDMERREHTRRPSEPPKSSHA